MDIERITHQPLVLSDFTFLSKIVSKDGGHSCFDTMPDGITQHERSWSMFFAVYVPLPARSDLGSVGWCWDGNIDFGIERITL